MRKKEGPISVEEAKELLKDTPIPAMIERILKGLSQRDSLVIALADTATNGMMTASLWISAAQAFGTSDGRQLLEMVQERPEMESVLENTLQALIQNHIVARTDPSDFREN